VKRSSSPILRNSPDRSNHPSNRVTDSPERTPIDPPYSSSNPEDSRGAGSRHRSSQNRTRRDDNAHHPDYVERAKPPRSYRNAEGWEQGPSSASKPYVEESRFNRDLERGREDWSPEEKRISDEEDSLDGYNYDARRKRPARRTIDFKNLSPEEKAEVMRLPWTQWMNSSVKNRKFDLIALVVHANSR
jgi:aquaporin related protein